MLGRERGVRREEDELTRKLELRRFGIKKGHPLHEGRVGEPVNRGQRIASQLFHERREPQPARKVRDRNDARNR